MTRLLCIGLLGSIAGAAWAEPVTYNVDPNHTHPSFETDHFGGLSTWRGLFKKTTGTIVMDTTAGTGAVDITVDVASIDLGHDMLNEIVVGSSEPRILEAAQYPVATYKGTLGDFVDGRPTTVNGNLALHGVTRPVALKIASFKCIATHPLIKREVCGADAQGSLNRADFGITVGQSYGFKMDVNLRIQVEAIRAN